MSEKTTTTIQIDRYLWRHVKDLAYSEGITVSEALEQLLRKILEVQA